MTSYSFVLDSFSIGEARSLVEDTVYLSWTLAVTPQGAQPSPRTKIKSMGTLYVGTHNVNLAFTNIAVNPTDTVVLNYLLVNAGSTGRLQVETTLEAVGAKLVTAGSSLGVPQLSSAMQALSKWLPQEFKGITNSHCDGPVAAEQDNFSGEGLLAMVPPLPPAAFTQGTENPGIDSATGCGRNSYYFVNWHIVRAS